ncbi:neurotrypsin, partial [Biomphalaria glabrata]
SGAKEVSENKFTSSKFNNEYLLDEVSCPAYVTTLDECSHSGWGKHNCASEEKAGVICAN